MGRRPPAGETDEWHRSPVQRREVVAQHSGGPRMTQHEVAQVLAEMSAMWPQREMSPPEVQLWVSEFLPLRAEATMAAVRELRKVCDWLPTHNQFLANYQA